MAIKTRLAQRQTVSPALSPQLRQAIALLQLSNVELTAAIADAIEQNPFLEWADSAEGSEVTGRNRPPRPRIAPPRPASPAPGWSSSLAALFGTGRRRAATRPDAEEGRGSGIRSGDPSLGEHLTRQLHETADDSLDLQIGAFLIGNLDEAGYLRTTLADAALQLGCDESRVATVLGRVQRFDPPGVFARDLGECLSLQLEERGRLDPAMSRLIGNLDILARGDRAALRRVCKVDDATLDRMIAELRSLDPKPGTRFASDPAATLVPDVLVSPAPNGDWHVELNPDCVPRVVVNNAYRSDIAGRLRRDDKRYLSECASSANWLIDALRQRSSTILEVAREIVDRQRDFLNGGVTGLRPMVLRDIANAVDLHESTVSRATSNKYMATPRGVFTFKYFFTTAVPRSDGGATVSSRAVRHRIAQLVANEGAESALSDARIAEILEAEGIAIARRTVAKYRRILGLETSAMRRRRKHLDRK